MVLKVLSFHMLDLWVIRKTFVQELCGIYINEGESRRGLLLSANRPCLCSLVMCFFSPAASLLPCSLLFPPPPTHTLRKAEMRKRWKMIMPCLPHLGVKYPAAMEGGYQEQWVLGACGYMSSTTQKYSDFLWLLSFCQIFLKLIIKD